MDPITSLLIGLALQVGVGLLRSIFAKPAPKPDQRQSGIRQQLAIGGDEPLSFIMGRYGTAGYLEYVGTWGEVDDVPNAYLTMVISVSDLPVRGLVKLFVNGEDVTIGASHNAKGYPVTVPGDGGTRHMWIEFFDGTQTTADSFLLDKFPSGNRAWQSDMIGRGIAYARITTLFNRELFNGIPEFYFTIDGIELDDPRGGDEGQANPIVMTHQTLSGIYFGDEWVWGLQGLPSTRLPASIQDEMDKCDVLVDQKGGGTEKRFRAGAEIRVDQQPIEVIPELLETCNGRVAEIGGIYKFLVAEPAAAVVSFTDEDIVITETQSFAPFPGLEATFNAINSTYVEPDERWAVKSAPQLRDASLEADDDDGLLPASVSNPFVFSATQRQRLDSALLEEHRRFRSHAMTMPPEWWEYEVLDVAQWTSGRNGYIGKDGLITMMDDLPNGNQFVGWKEQDPDVYDWDPDADEQDYDVVPLLIERPSPQLMTGWGVAPAFLEDPDGHGWLPSMEVSYAAGLVDVNQVRVQVRETWDAERLAFDGTITYDPADLSPSVILNAAFLPATLYAVRGKLIPFSGRITRWSNEDEDGTDLGWFEVTTPNVSPLPPASIFLETLADDLRNSVGLITDPTAGSILDQLVQLRARADELAAAVMDVAATSKERLDLLDVSREGAAAAIIRSEVAIVNETEARATAIEEVVASFGDSFADGFLKFDALVNSSEATATITAKVRAEADGTLSQAAWIIKASVTGGDPQSVFGIYASRFALVNDINDLTVSPFYTDAFGNVYITSAMIAQASITSAYIGPGAVTNSKLGSNSVATGNLQDGSLTRAKFALKVVGGAQIDDLAVGFAQMGNAVITSQKVAYQGLNDRNSFAFKVIGGAQIDDLTIGASNLANGQITSAKVAYQGLNDRNSFALKVVGGAQIDDLAVGNSHIKNLSVDRIKIAGAAVTDLVSDIVVSGSTPVSTSYQTICSISVNAGDYPIPIGAYLDWTTNSTSSATREYEFMVELIVNGEGHQLGYKQRSIQGGDRTKTPIICATVPALPAGSYTVRFRQRSSTAAGSNHSVHRASLVAGQPQK